MSEILKSHIKKFVVFDDNQLDDILSFFKPHTLKKKENIVSAGHICRNLHFVARGCLRMFFINEKGSEQTIDFAIENWWITDHIAFERRLASEFSIQAVEKSELLTIDRDAYEKLLVAFPKMERYFRFIYQRAYAASQRRIKFLYELSKEELYRHFSKHYPKFIQRVPQHLVASFLGFTPEYLSEIIKRTAP